MCGIAGIMSLAAEPLSEASLRSVRAMSDTMQHRGPDDNGEWTSADRRVMFAHRRLSIIDPTAEAHQPMISVTGSVLNFNGEIYNYRELRKEYALDVPLSDTAVLLTLLERHGTAILPKLRGFFAFAFYNAANRSLTLARDAIGKKPIYYAYPHNAFLFASEQRALMRSGLIEFRISRELLGQYLQHYSVPHPASLITGVHTLAPGHTLRIDAAGHSVLQRWYELPKHSPITIDYADAVKEVRGLLETSVRYRLVSDVPVGAFLSGGLDSNAIVGLMSREVSSPIETFTIGFQSGRQAQSEVDIAQIGATAFGTRHHARTLTSGDVMSVLPQFFWSMDSPTGDGLNSFLVAKTAHEIDPQLKVVLSGVGGDEVFLGYRKYRWLAERSRVLKALWTTPRAARTRLARALAGNSNMRMLNAVRTVLDPMNVRALFSPAEIHALSGGADPSPTTEQDESIEELLRFDFERYLPDMLLRDLDVMTMSQSLEARAPLLDRSLIEFVWQLPLEFKTRGNSKQLLADAVQDILPKAITEKPKTGFELPMAEWLRNGELRPMLDLLRIGNLTIIEHGLLAPKPVRKVYNDFIAGRSHYLKPWTLLALEYWYRSFTTNLTHEDWCSGAWKSQ